MSLFLPSEVLSAPVNWYYFLWAPLRSAAYNYTEALWQQKLQLDKKTDLTAKAAFKEIKWKSSWQDKATHYGVHTFTALFLSIPLINYLPFSYLVIKAKENLSYDEAGQLSHLIVSKNVFLQSTQHLSNTSSNFNKTTCKSVPTIEITPEPKIHQEIVSPLRPKLERKMAFKVKERSKSFQNTETKQFLPRTNSLTQINRKDRDLAIKGVRELEENVTLDYFVLFPDESDNSLIRKIKDLKRNKTSLNERTEVGKLLLNSNFHLDKKGVVGDINKSKLENAQKNLNILKNLLKEKFGVNYSYLQRTSGRPVSLVEPLINAIPSANDIPNEKTNPYEIIKKSIFSLSNDDFSALLSCYNFEIYSDVIRITNLNIGD